MKIPCCALDPECRKYAALWRITIVTKLGALTIALRWRDRVQLWLPWKTRNPWTETKANYTRWWVPVAWHPRSRSRSIRKDGPVS